MSETYLRAIHGVLVEILEELRKPTDLTDVTKMAQDMAAAQRAQWLKDREKLANNG
jgi:hypothetical protein